MFGWQFCFGPVFPIQGISPSAHPDKETVNLFGWQFCFGPVFPIEGISPPAHPDRQKTAGQNWSAVFVLKSNVPEFLTS